MRFYTVIAVLLGYLSFASATSNGLTQAVTWDKYSLSVNGTRVYIRFVQSPDIDEP
jgi:beta-galactosidase